MQLLTPLRSALVLSAMLVLSACGQPPASNAYYNRGAPESLLDVSSELVNLSTANSADVAELGEWIQKERPTRAELNCDSQLKSCKDAKRLLSLKRVPVVTNEVGSDTVTLVYERVVTRDCEQRFVDSHQNHYNVNHKAFGCSIASNMLQQISDKQQILNPRDLDKASAVRAVNDHHRAYTPRPVIAPYSAIDRADTSDSK
jgi:type IV pilus biogenesis protein CpaD/CtpE